jgi:hypothetical protein
MNAAPKPASKHSMRNARRHNAVRIVRMMALVPALALGLGACSMMSMVTAGVSSVGTAVSMGVSAAGSAVSTGVSGAGSAVGAVGTGGKTLVHSDPTTN